MRNHLATSSLRWLTGLEIPLEDIDGQLRRCLGCWAATSLIGNYRGDPGDGPLRRLVGLPPFAVDRFPGDPVLALALHAALRRRGLHHPSLAALAGLYARAVKLVESTDSPRNRRLGLIRALLESAGLSDPATSTTHLTSPRNWDVEPTRPQLDDRDGVLRFAQSVAVATVWGSRPIPITGRTELLPALAVSAATDADPELVCALLRSCGYLGLADQPDTRSATNWLIDQHHDGQFTPTHTDPQSTLHTTTPTAVHPFPLTVEALWTLAELRRPGFLLGPADTATDLRTVRSRTDLQAVRSRPTSAPLQRRSPEWCSPPTESGVATP
jgi:hypothetical protein